MGAVTGNLRENSVTGEMAFGSGMQPVSLQRLSKEAFEGNKYPDLSPPSVPSPSGSQRQLEGGRHRIGFQGHRVNGEEWSGFGVAKGSHLTHCLCLEILYFSFADGGFYQHSQG